MPWQEIEASLALRCVRLGKAEKKSEELRPWRDGVLLGSDVGDFVNPRQIAVASSRALLARGQLIRLAYAKPDAVQALGVAALILT